MQHHTAQIAQYLYQGRQNRQARGVIFFVSAGSFNFLHKLSYKTKLD